MHLSVLYVLHVFHCLVLYGNACIASHMLYILYCMHFIALYYCIVSNCNISYVSVLIAINVVVSIPVELLYNNVLYFNVLLYFELHFSLIQSSNCLT